MSNPSRLPFGPLVSTPTIAGLSGISVIGLSDGVSAVVGAQTGLPVSYALCTSSAAPDGVSILVTFDDASKRWILLTGGAAAVNSSDFFEQTKAWAADRVPELGAGRLLSTDFLGASGDDFFLSGGAAAPTFDTAYTGGVLKVPGAGGDGQVNLGNTLNKPLLAFPRSEPWAFRALVRQGATAFTGGINGGVFYMTDGVKVISLSSLGGLDTHKYFLFLTEVGTSFFKVGTVGTVGTASCPAFSWMTMGLWFDSEVLQLEFNDLPAFAPGTGADRLAPLQGADLNNMPTTPLGVGILGGDVNFGLRVDAMGLVVL